MPSRCVWSIDADAATVILGAVLYLCAALASLRLPPGLLGPDPAAVRPGLAAVIASTARGLADGVRHLNAAQAAARVLPR